MLFFTVIKRDLVCITPVDLKTMGFFSVPSGA
jgi:hypothetical protein